MDWRKRYSRLLLASDSLVVFATVFGVQLLWFGPSNETVAFSAYTPTWNVTYTQMSLLLVAIWLIILALFGTRRPNLVGSGSDEYKLISDATIRLFGLVAITAYLLQAQLARGYILLALPTGLVLLLLERWCWRMWLARQRKSGRYSRRAIIVGTAASVDQVATILHNNPIAGFDVIAAYIADYSGNSRRKQVLEQSQVPIAGRIDDALLAMDNLNADTLIISSSDELSPEEVRKLSWGLEPGRQHLVVAPNLIDVSGPRIHMRPVAGLPLVHIETPQLSGVRAVSKTVIDFIGSILLLVVLSPVFLVVAILVKAGSRGPVFFKQTRVGYHGETFVMYKFRTMVSNAEQLLVELEQVRREEQDLGNEVLFKMKDDPRVTRVGKTLRRYSLDELPQLLNVVRGDMSLVGPRPPLPKEVNSYEDHVHRRFLVKPGMTGLWQVSGRSELSWEESVRADLFYVENWSLTGDLVIIWRTFKAVLFPGSGSA